MKTRPMLPEHYRGLLHAARDRKGRAAGRDAFMLWFVARLRARTLDSLKVRVGDVHLETSPPYVTVGRRAVHLDTKAVRRIGRWLRFGLPRSLGRAAHAGDPLIPAAFGQWVPGPMNRRNAHRIFSLYARRAQLPDGINLRSLRFYRDGQMELPEPAGAPQPVDTPSFEEELEA